MGLTLLLNQSAESPAGHFSELLKQEQPLAEWANRCSVGVSILVGLSAASRKAEGEYALASKVEDCVPRNGRTNQGRRLTS